MIPTCIKLSKAEQVRGQILEDILAGRLRPGDKLIEEDIAARARCSRTPVREAIRRLDAIGVLSFRPNHGAWVTSDSPRAMADLRDALAELEACCAEMAVGRLSPEARERLSRLAALGGEEAEVFQLLHDVAGNRVIQELVRSLNTRLYQAPTAPSVSGRDARALLPVISAVLDGDGAAARTAMRAHLRGART